MDHRVVMNMTSTRARCAEIRLDTRRWSQTESVYSRNYTVHCRSRRHQHLSVSMQVHAMQESLFIR